MCLETFPTHFYFLTGKNSLGTPPSVSSVHSLCLPLCYRAHDRKVPAYLAPHLFSIHRLAFLNWLLLWEITGIVPAGSIFSGHLPPSTMPNLSKILLTHTQTHKVHRTYIYAHAQKHTHIYVHINNWIYAYKLHLCFVPVRPSLPCPGLLQQSPLCASCPHSFLTIIHPI